MKIEKELPHFKNGFSARSLHLTDLQKQYLSVLASPTSIEGTVEFFLKQGWLVSFNDLYSLIKVLLDDGAILNPSFHNYFHEANHPKTLSFQTAKAEKKSLDITRSELQTMPFFRSLDPRLSDYLLQKAFMSVYPARTYICKAGEQSRDLYLLLEGQAGIYRPTREGHQMVATISDGGVFGEAGFFLGSARSASIATLKDSRVLTIPFLPEIMEKYVDKSKAQGLQLRFWVQQALQSSSFFQNIPTDSLDALAFCGKVVSLSANQILFRESEPGQTAYIVIQGSLVASQKGQSIRVLNQGAFFGEIALLINQGKRTATVHSQQDCLLLEINQSEFYKLLSQNIFLAKELEGLAHSRIESDRKR